MEGPRAKKSLGQNFLIDGNIAAKIVGTLFISPQDKVVEIGPGAGALTERIRLAAPAELLLVEKDGHWAAEREKSLAGYEGKASVLAEDALHMPWEGIPPPWKCIGNLPYNIASPLMWEIFSRASGLARAVFMIQKEVGERVIAQPGTKAYGALSVWVQSHMTPKLEFTVPPQVFVPRPKVYSAVLSFVPAATSALPLPQERAALGMLLRRCFQQRRKQLGTILKGCAKGDALWADSGIAPERRPETLTPQQFLSLSRLLRDLPSCALSITARRQP